MDTSTEFIPLHEVDTPGPGLIYGKAQKLYVRKHDLGKDFLYVYNENAEIVGFFEDLHELQGELGPEGEYER